jgi:hypothetical protein
MFMCHYYGITIQEYLSNPSLNADVFVEFVKEFDFDSIKAGMGYILYGCGPELGTTWKFVESDFPGCIKGIIDEPEDVEKVVIPTEPTGYFRNFLEINRRVKALIGHETFLGISILGPFSVMAFLRGFENLLTDIGLELDFFATLMRMGEEVSLFIGRHCLELGLQWNNMLEIFLIPGMFNPDFFHAHIATHDDAVCKQLGASSLPNSNAAFMGRAGDKESQRGGSLLYDYYFGTKESLEVIRSASDYMLSGFPRLVSLSGRALVTWPTDRILLFLRQGLDYFVKERGAYPSIHLASIQASSPEEARAIAQKLRAVTELRDTYLL